MRRYASGGNYEIDIDEHRVAACRVWRRPDVDAETGARFAHEKIAHFAKLAAGEAIGLVFDLREAPPVVGPKSEQAIGDMLASWEAAARRIALLVGEHAVQQLQMKRLAAARAPMSARVETNAEAAQRWARGR